VPIGRRFASGRFVGLGEHAFDDVGFLDTGQFHVQSTELEGEAFVVNAEAMQDRGVEIA
jgi:rare lipoprotein A (peptidoglycan hydrolase)